jgi:hypothetical protein
MFPDRGNHKGCRCNHLAELENLPVNKFPVAISFTLSEFVSRMPRARKAKRTPAALSPDALQVSLALDRGWLCPRCAGDWEEEHTPRCPVRRALVHLYTLAVGLRKESSERQGRQRFAMREVAERLEDLAAEEGCSAPFLPLDPGDRI